MPSPTSPIPVIEAPRMNDPAIPVPAGSSPFAAEARATPIPTATQSTALTNHDAVAYACTPSIRERSSSVRPTSSSARPLRVTRNAAPIARLSAIVIQPLVHTAPPRVFATGDRPVSALMPGVSETAAKSSSDCWVGNSVL